MGQREEGDVEKHEEGKTRIFMHVELHLCSPGLTLLLSLGHAGGAGCGEGAVPGVWAARGEGSDVLGLHAVSSG